MSTDQDSEYLRVARECGAYSITRGLRDPVRFWWASEADFLALCRAMEVRGMRKAAWIAQRAVLPVGYRWGRDALEAFEFGRERAAESIESAAAELEKGK